MNEIEKEIKKVVCHIFSHRIHATRAQYATRIYNENSYKIAAICIQFVVIEL